jgi:hypothetical protein
MFKYTPAKTIVADLKRLKKTKKVVMYGDYYVVRAFLQSYGINSFNDYVQFERNFVGTTFYSIEPRMLIPVGSALIPANLFDITICN